ncbi:hypothetical protein FHX11_005487 [Rhizobium sp. BK602]|nr:hypothetical protein [Rhizobium sp. BK602]
MRIDNEPGDLILLVGNEKVGKEGLERNVGQADAGGGHFLRRFGCDAREKVS